jgi:hypothetical protein
MRFRIDVVFLDEALGEVSIRHGLGPRRLAFERGARHVLEVPAR